MGIVDTLEITAERPARFDWGTCTSGKEDTALWFLTGPQPERFISHTRAGSPVGSKVFVGNPWEVQSEKKPVDLGWCGVVGERESR